jgi:diketogulonate reductase-like aldo/keto reductase
MIPALGQGGWTIGDDATRAESESAALRRGIELGVNLIDTAEMYGSGRSEELIGSALRGIPRDKYLLVSKVYPHNADRKHIFRSCEASLHRLGTDHLDLYLLHWRGAVPLEETVWCMEKLVKDGKIRRWGVSNFDVPDMEELWSIDGGKNCAVNQVLYNITSRGIEYDLIPWCKAHNVAIMAYCPLAQAGRLKRMNIDIRTEPTLTAVAGKYNATVMQVMLAFVLRQSCVAAIPKAGSVAHVEQNAAAAKLQISGDDWAALDAVFWPPTCKMHLDIE